MADDIKKIMIEVAQTIADRARAADEPPFAEQIDALKALTAMYAALHKHPSDDTAETGDGFDFSKPLDSGEEDPPDARTTVTPIRTRRRPG